LPINLWLLLESWGAESIRGLGNRSWQSATEMQNARVTQSSLAHCYPPANILRLMGRRILLVVSGFKAKKNSSGGGCDNVVDLLGGRFSHGRHRGTSNHGQYHRTTTQSEETISDNCLLNSYTRPMLDLLSSGCGIIGDRTPLSLNTLRLGYEVIEKMI